MIAGKVFRSAVDNKFHLTFRFASILPRRSILLTSKLYFKSPAAILTTVKEENLLKIRMNVRKTANPEWHMLYCHVFKMLLRATGYSVGDFRFGSGISCECVIWLVTHASRSYI